MFIWLGLYILFKIDSRLLAGIIEKNADDDTAAEQLLSTLSQRVVDAINALPRPFLGLVDEESLLKMIGFALKKHHMEAWISVLCWRNRESESGFPAYFIESEDGEKRIAMLAEIQVQFNITDRTWYVNEVIPRDQEDKPRYVKDTALVRRLLKD